MGIIREDIDGTVTRHSSTAFSLILFDSVPGGAGHARRLGQELSELVAAALRRVESCECGEDTSCYSCLRSYSNQLFHDQLSRSVAAEILRATLRSVAHSLRFRPRYFWPSTLSPR